MKQHAFSRLQAVQLPYLGVIRKDAIVLFGEVLADMFPDKTVLGGAPFNVARHLKAFGQNPVIITRLGSDDLGDEVLRVMSQNSMETLGIQRCAECPTGRVRVHIKNRRHHFEILPSQAYDFIDQVMSDLAALSVQPVLVYFGTLANGKRSPVKRSCLCCTRLRQRGFSISTYAHHGMTKRHCGNPCDYADIVKLNADELTVLVEMFGLAGSTPEDQVRRLLHIFDIERSGSHVWRGRGLADQSGRRNS